MNKGIFFVLHEPVFVLHTRPYRNSSLIVELFSRQYGRICAVARSARGLKSRFRGQLQLFSPLLASWSGRRELMNLNQIEWRGLPLQLGGQSLICAFYLNELILTLLPREDPYPEIFLDYETALHGLEQSSQSEAVLRRFEKHLLDGLGYGLCFNEEAGSGKSIEPQGLYQWLPDGGFQRCLQSRETERIFLGKSLLAMQVEKWEDSQDLLAAKRLMRLVINRHLGGKRLKSRELLI